MFDFPHTSTAHDSSMKRRIWSTCFTHFHSHWVIVLKEEKTREHHQTSPPKASPNSPAYLGIPGFFLRPTIVLGACDSLPSTVAGLHLHRRLLEAGEDAARTGGGGARRVIRGGFAWCLLFFFRRRKGESHLEQMEVLMFHDHFKICRD